MVNGKWKIVNGKLEIVNGKWEIVKIFNGLRKSTGCSHPSLFEERERG